jgi:glycosyltransferase involved in cell wall biosynthesis
MFYRWKANMSPTSGPPKKRILMIAMANSIHVARWLELMDAIDVDVRLISSNASRSPHPRIVRLSKRASNDPGLHLEISLISRYFSVLLWFADRFLSDWLRGLTIFINILKFKPDLVHVLELQNAGYPTIRAFQLLRKDSRPRLFITNYGSDVFWYKNFPKHEAKIRKLLALADAFSAECERDVQIAKGLGFTNYVLKTIPVTGGLEIASLPVLENDFQLNSRRSIAIKGYQGKWGRAVEALDALEQLPPDLLSNFKVEIYSCEPAVELAASRLRKQGVNISTYPKGELSHQAVLDLFRRSRMYVGLSRSDGISTSMLEAMSQGAVPIQTDTSCANEWLSQDSQGFVANLARPGEITAAMEHILRDDTYVLKAQSTNLAVIKMRYDKKQLGTVVAGYYRDLLGSETNQDKAE